MKPTFDIAIEGGDWPNERVLKDWVDACWEATSHALSSPCEPIEVSILFGDDARIQDLNRSFRGFDKPTNVLSFEPAQRDQQQGFLGDIALAFETVRGEAERAGLPLKDHTQHLIVHAILHLHGYDHIIDEDAAFMEALEVKVLHAMGLHNPYIVEHIAES